jgi:hypothetical protein
VTLDEKRGASLAELLACMRQIISEDTRNLNSAKWLAATSLAIVATISEQGRVLSTEESIEWVKRQGWALELLNNIEDVTDVHNFNLIHPKLWNAVTAMKTNAQAALLHRDGKLREVLQSGLALVESAFAHVSHGGPTRADAEKWIQEARNALS